MPESSVPGKVSAGAAVRGALISVCCLTSAAHQETSKEL